MLALFSVLSVTSAQGISIVFNNPATGQIVHESVDIKVTLTSTFELQSVQASISNHSVILTPASGNQWTNALSLTGLSFGTNTLQIIATDVFGSSNQAQRTIVYDLVPSMNVSSPVDGSVIRATVLLNASASDDDPAVAPALQVMQAVDYSGGSILAASASSINTNTFLPDGSVNSLFFKTIDSANQIVGTFRVVYSELSTNLVEVARMSGGEIKDVQTDRILFLTIDNKTLPSGVYDASTRFRLMAMSRTNGSESLVYENVGNNISTSFLAPGGAVMVINIPPPGYASGAGIYHLRNGTFIQYGSSAFIAGSFGLKRS